MSLAIKQSEYEDRLAGLAEYLRKHELTGAVLFDPYYVLYYAGFAFAPTERPIAFVLNAEGEGGMLVPRLEREHAQANASVDHVADYPEYPSETHPTESLRTLLAEMGVDRLVRRRPGRISVGARLPRADADGADGHDTAQDHRFRRGPDGDQEPGGDRTDPRELEVGQPRTRSAAAVHTPGADRERSVSAREHRGLTRDARRDRLDLSRTELLLRRGGSRLLADRSAATPRSRTRSPTTSFSRRATCSSPERPRLCGATSRSSSARW